MSLVTDPIPPEERANWKELMLEKATIALAPFMELNCPNVHPCVIAEKLYDIWPMEDMLVMLGFYSRVLRTAIGPTKLGLDNINGGTNE